MARLTGTVDNDTLIGGNGRDLIRGVAGYDSLVGGGGRDTLMGAGLIEGGPGPDTYYSVQSTILSTTSSVIQFRSVDLGPGNDRMVLNDHDDVFGGQYAGFSGSFGLLTGDGNDTVIIGSMNAFVSPILGAGADTAYIIPDTEPGRGHAIGLGPSISQADAQSDIVHYATNGQNLLIYSFGETDKLIIYGVDATYDDVASMTSFQFAGQETSLILTLPDGGEITVSKRWEGQLGPDNIEFRAENLSVTSPVQIGNSVNTRKGYFASNRDDVVRKQDTVFAGDGDDNVLGRDTGDRFYGEGGNDTLTGAKGNDTLYGGAGDDKIRGGLGKDLIKTGAGADDVLGNSGSDTIIIGRGAAKIGGGKGNDTFVFEQERLGASFGEEGFLRIKGGSGRDDYEIPFAAGGLIVIDDFRPGRDDIFLGPFPDSYSPERQEDLRDNVWERGSVVAAGDDYPVSGLLVSVIGTQVLLRGLEPGDLSEADVLLA